VYLREELALGLVQDWMELLRHTLEAAGPAFIKWGQWAATRHDIFPPDFCRELERLHSQAPAHSFRYTKAAIEHAFGLPLADLFSHVDQQPVASGSIGQVHRATLSERGAAIAGNAGTSLGS
jgi:aarF domain-containing kinase